MSDAELLNRYVLERRLGAGGYGEVYAAHDLRLGRKVAIKRLRSLDPEHLLRFKREFRALTGISHPNLVCLYDLFTEHGAYFLSMELVEGTPLVAYVRDATTPERERETVQTGDAKEFSVDLMRQSSVSLRPSLAPREHPSRSVAPIGPAGLDRIRAVFAQLGEALASLHAAGMLHRDLKPSNVLVTPDGRVVVLDFGLVLDVAPERATHQTRSLVGTPYYMSPEQASSETIGPSADLYAVGVMLYECLVGATPFEGMTALQAIVSKVRGEIDDVRALAPHLPADLGELCMELLRVEPDARPSAADVAHRLASSGRRIGARETPSLVAPRFVGRDAELATLRAVQTKSASGTAGFALLEGESGMGKSSLADRFLAWADADDRALVLRGRCYENDSLPNKLLDSVVDSLSAHLARVPDSLRRGVLPVEIAELVRVFPVLGRIDEIAERCSPSAMRDDPREARRHAELAFAELLSRLGEIRPVVVFVDDVQWGDASSLGFLRALLASTTERRVMVLLAYRAEERHSSPFVRSMHESIEAGEVAKPTLLSIGRLSNDDAEALARHLADDSRGARVAELIAKEGRGHPLFIEELVRYVRASDATPRIGDAEPTSDLGQLLLADVIVRRVDAQSETATRLLYALAVVGVPIEPKAAFRAIDVAEVDSKMLHRLRAEHLVRRSGSDDDGFIACYHDRIRESLLARLSPETRRAYHLGLASALEKDDGTPASLLAMQYFGAGAMKKAAEHAAVAGERALSTLAFGEAQSFFARSLRWDPEPSERRTKTIEQHGHALFNLGKCREAADEYLAAADLLTASDPRAALRLRTRAAEAYLIGGDDERGEPMMRAVLADVGVGYPATPFRTKLRLGWNMMRLGTNLSVPLVAPKPAGPATVDRIHVLFAAQRAYVLRDFVRAMVFSMEGLREALAVGDTNHIMEGVALYAALSSMADLRGAPALMKTTHDLAEKLETDFAHGMTHLARGIDFFGRTLMRESYTNLRRAVELLGRCAGVTPLRLHAEAMEILLLRCIEDFETLRKRSDETIRTARALGNPYVEALARHDSCVAILAADDPSSARGAIDAALAAVPGDDLYVVYSALHYRVKCHRYLGEWDRAHELIESKWGELESRSLLTNTAGRVIYGGLRVGSALGLAANEPKKRGALVRRAKRALAPFRKATAEWSVGYRGLLEAAIASLEGDTERAHALAVDSGKVLDEGRLPVFAESARLRAAQLARDDAAIAHAESGLRLLGVANPSAWVDSVAPGFVV